MVSSERLRGLSSGLSIVFFGLVVLLLPISFELSTVVDGGGHPPFFIRVPLADVLLWLALTVAFVRRRVDVGAAPSLLPSVLAVALVGLATTVSQLSDGASWTECLQRIDYFLVAYLVATAAPLRLLRHMIGPALIGATSLFLLLGIVQIAIGEPPWRITSVFEDRHLFGGWVAIASAALTARGPFRGWRPWAGAVIFLAAALTTATTLLPLVGIAVGAGVSGWSHKRWRGLGIAAGFLVLAATAFVALAPKAHRDRSLEEWSLRDVTSPEELHERGAEIDGLGTSMELVSLRRGIRLIRISSPNWHPDRPQTGDPRRDIVFESDYLRQRFLEWQAALSAASESPVLGHGLGSYQTLVSKNYRTFKKLKTLEPDTQSAYAVELVSTGLVGLMMLVWFLLDGSFPACCVGESCDLRETRAALLTAMVLGFAIPIWTCFLAVMAVLMAVAASRSRNAA